ncbi:MAG TPA: metalloregulator ArsR/SmtB family transcription factor [Tepidisphaeraceae bacterium]|nr:metalloregulator ArsR/SmtB family transcription factor [Tepidisphaeraceae bacterium]
MKASPVKSLSHRPRGRSSDGRGGAGLEPAQIAAVAALFAVLSEESRLLILQALQDGPASVGELVDRLGLKQANVSKQLGILLTAGVVSRRQEGNRAIFSIAMPLVNDLCDLVCRGVRQLALERAEALK